MFYPNKLKKEDIVNLSPWELLVAACHFGPKMGDCVSLNYGYEKRGNTIYCDDISLEDDIDLSKPMDAILHYAVDGDWTDLCKNILDNYFASEGGER